jgi:hypothetical protein
MSDYRGDDWFREQMIAAAQEALDKGWKVKGDPRVDRMIVAYPPEREGDRWYTTDGYTFATLGGGFCAWEN